LGIDLLSLAERILLVEEIWDGIAPDADGLDIPQSPKVLRRVTPGPQSCAHS
jgi:putative addiction module component (TIGR02574 family)